jgi:catechol 2,3-dioxygenase
MAQIQRMSPRPRRPGELGVHSVDHFNFVVPDLKQAQKFYTDFDLDLRED